MRRGRCECCRCCFCLRRTALAGSAASATIYADLPLSLFQLLYYQLSKGQAEAELLSDAWIGTEEAIVTYDGNLSGHHTWEKISFQHSTWLQPNSADGLVDNQALTYHCSGTPCGNCTGSPGSATCRDNIGGSAPGAVRIIIVVIVFT